MKFSNLIFNPHPNFSNKNSFMFSENAIQAVAKFSNGYGLSVVRFPGSYGYEFGQYECAVIKFKQDSEEFQIVYNTPITDDVVGFCCRQEVEELLKKVEAL